MIKIKAGHEVMKRLCDSLGISGPVNKLVIEIPACGACVVYVKRFLLEDNVEAVRDAINSASGEFSSPVVCKELEVADDCKVQSVPCTELYGLDHGSPQ